MQCFLSVWDSFLSLSSLRLCKYTPKSNQIAYEDPPQPAAYLSLMTQNSTIFVYLELTPTFLVCKVKFTSILRRQRLALKIIWTDARLDWKRSWDWGENGRMWGEFLHLLPLKQKTHCQLCCKPRSLFFMCMAAPHSNLGVSLTEMQAFYWLEHRHLALWQS